MIVRLTINDNDFNDIIEDYFKNFWFKLTDFTDEDLQKTNLRDVIKKNIALKKLLNPNEHITTYTKEHEQVILDRVIETFNNFIDNNEKESADYIKRNVKITILYSLEDKWENGEAWYWLQHSDTVINQ